MASIRSGTIAFGLVAIPVRVYVATHSAQLSFNLLHQGCGARIRQRLGVQIPTKPNGSSDGRRAPDPSEAEHLVRAKASSPTGAP